MEKIMILDGNTQDLRDLSSALSPFFIVLSCSRWVKALDILKVFQPAGLILDPSMPSLEITDFIRQARFLSQSPSLVVAAVSAMSNLAQISRAFEWEVDLAFSKPVDALNIAKKLRNLIVIRYQTAVLETVGRGVDPFNPRFLPEVNPVLILP